MAPLSPQYLGWAMSNLTPALLQTSPRTVRRRELSETPPPTISDLHLRRLSAKFEVFLPQHVILGSLANPSAKSASVGM